VAATGKERAWSRMWQYPQRKRFAPHKSGHSGACLTRRREDSGTIRLNPSCYVLSSRLLHVNDDHLLAALGRLTPLPEKCIFLVVAFERLRRYNPESNVTQAALLYRRLSSSSLPRTLSMQYRHNRGLYTNSGRAVVWNNHWQRQVGPDGTESR
jgi:hypothetical protein